MKMPLSSFGLPPNAKLVLGTKERLCPQSCTSAGIHKTVLIQSFINQEKRDCHTRKCTSEKMDLQTTFAIEKHKKYQILQYFCSRNQ